MATSLLPSIYLQPRLATIAPFEATELSQNRLKYASYSLMFPSVCAFLVLILIIVIGFFTIWRKDLQMNRANATAQLNDFKRNSVAALASAQHLNALNSMSSYATPAATLHHPTGGSNQCALASAGHFADELRDHSCGDEHLLNDACFQLASTNTANLAGLANGCANACNANCNHYTLNTFGPVYGQPPHDPNGEQFKDNLNNLNGTLNPKICQTMNKGDCHQDCHPDCHLALPTPYSTNQLEAYDRVLKQTTSISNQLANANLTNPICGQHTTYTVTPITTGSLGQQTAAGNQMAVPNFSFDRYNNCPGNPANSEHQYDIPIPPKWV